MKKQKKHRHTREGLVFLTCKISRCILNWQVECKDSVLDCWNQLEVSCWFPGLGVCVRFSLSLWMLNTGLCTHTGAVLTEHLTRGPSLLSLSTLVFQVHNFRAEREARLKYRNWPVFLLHVAHRRVGGSLYCTFYEFYKRFSIGLNEYC